MKKAFINLLSQDRFASSPLGQTLNWTLHIGRWIVILTELIVIAAFLSRFYLDRLLSDLTEETAQQQAVISSFATFENQFRTIQKRFQVTEEIMANQPPYSQLVEQVASALPSDTQFQQVKFEENQLIILASTLSDSSIDTAINNLSQIDTLSNLHVSRIKLETKDVYIHYEVRATVNPHSP